MTAEPVVSGDSDATKTTRRLIPQFSLTKQDLGSENGRGRSGFDTPKKPVIRFTREQLISFRKESPLLSSMAHLTDVASVESLEPVCFSRLEPEDVARIYAIASKEGHGRGRARGKMIRQEDSGDKVSDEPKKTDLWDVDEATSSEPFDLADFAKAALKFRTDMEDFKGNLGFDDQMRQGDDAIASLIDHTPENIVPAVLQSSILPAEAALSSLLLEEPSDVPTSSEFSSIASVLNTNNANIFSLDLGTPLGGIFSGGESVEVVEWFYTDPQNNTQGPFPQDTMRLWNEEGYFTADLPIKLRRWTKFHMFKDVFPNQATAFIEVPAEPVSPFFLHEEVSPFRVVPQTFHAVVEETPVEVRGKPDVKPIEPVSTSHNVEKSDFAKKLLGIGRNKSVAEPRPVDVIVEPINIAPSTLVSIHEPSSEDQVSYAEINEPAVVDYSASVEKSCVEPMKSIEVPSKPTRGWNSASTKPVVRLTDIQQQQEKEETQTKPVALQVPSSPAPTQALSMSVQLKSLLGVKDPKNVWLTNSPSDVGVNSLKDIMKEEICRKHSSEASVSAEAVEIAKPTGTSWAAKARSAVVAPVAQPVIQPARSSLAVVTSVAQSVGHSAVSEVRDLAKPQQSVAISKPATQPQTKSGFGGKLMSKELSDWCSSQLIKITGSDDAMELMEFCMSLKSSVEIRSYLSQYLGSSPQVTNFATEFISLKDGKKFVAVEKVHDQKFQNVATKKKKPSMK